MKEIPDWFYNKELSDAIRDICINSPAAIDEVIPIMQKSKDYNRDSLIIKKLLIKGFPKIQVGQIILAINED